MDREASTSTVPAPTAPAKLVAHGRPRVEKQNKTEAAYEAYLNLRKITGEVVWFQFEGMTFKIGPDCRYTPDFCILLTDGTLEMHEVKGTEKRFRRSGEVVKTARYEDDSKVKIAVAASQFPIVFKMVYKVDGNWIEKLF
jgi:hypothetical protein